MTRTIILCVFAAPLIAAIAVYFVSPVISDDTTQRYLQQIAEYSKDNLQYTLLVRDPVAAQESVRELRNIPWVEYVSLSLPAFSETLESGETRWRPGLDDYSEHSVYHSEDGQYHVTSTVFIESQSGLKEIGGYLHIAVDRTPLSQIMNTTTLMFMLTVLLSCLIITPLLFRMMRKTLRPVEQLASQIDDLQPNEPGTTTVGIDSAPEDLQKVSTVINALLEKQRDHVNHLEERVLERTKDRDLFIDQYMKAEEQKKSIMMNLSHDLKTPLTSTLGFISLAKEDIQEGDTDQAEDNLVQAEKHALLLSDEITTLLHFSASERKELKPVYSQISITALLESIVSAAKPNAMTANNTITYTHTGSPLITTDSYILKHIVENIIMNSNKFCSDGTITLSSATADDFELRISDTGIGIPYDQQENIFNAHYQASFEKRTGSRGVGIGLSLCREWITLIGGTITVSSVPNINTTFTLTLPLMGCGVLNEPVEDISCNQTTV